MFSGHLENGALSALQPLAGGNNSQAYFVNNHGEIIGLSENGKYDTTCNQSSPFHVYRFEAIKWAPDGTRIPLRPLLEMGDTVSFGFGINDNGQAVGVSGLCSNVPLPLNNGVFAPHAVLWERDGSPHDLGTPPGGAGNNVGSSINNQGEVTMNSVMLDGTLHAFVLSGVTHVPQDLGTYPEGAPVTVAPCCHSINDRGQVVGFSVDAAGNFRALLWEDAVPRDLNSLLPADSPWYLQAATSINEAGEIVGWAMNVNTFEVHAFLASPIGRIGPAARGASKPPALPPGVRQLLRRHLHF